MLGTSGELASAEEPESWLGALRTGSAAAAGATGSGGCTGCTGHDLGRGALYSLAMEGALKLKEITYIHAEAYPAGELKHGPLALVDESMPVVVIAPKDSLLEKVKSNMQEVAARGGELFVFADLDSHFTESEGVHVIRTPRHVGVLSPVVHSIPVQLLAYHVALQRGTDVDKPRNLAKSVTVE